MIRYVRNFFLGFLLVGVTYASFDMPPTLDDMPDDQKSVEVDKDALSSQVRDYDAQISDLSKREAALAAQIRNDEDTRGFIESNNAKINQAQMLLDDPDKASEANKEIADLQRRNNTLAQGLTLTPEDRAGVQAQMEDLRGQRDVLAAQRANAQAKIEGRELPYPTLEEDRAPVQPAETTPPARPARRAPPLPPTQAVSVAPEKTPPPLPARRPVPAAPTTYQRGLAPALPPRSVPTSSLRPPVEIPTVDDTSEDADKSVADKSTADAEELKKVQSELKLQRGLAASGFGDSRTVQQLEAREAELSSGGSAIDRVAPISNTDVTITDATTKKPSVYRRFINTVTGRTAAQKATAPGGEVYATNQRIQAQQEAQRQLIAEQSQDQRNISSISQKLQEQQERIAQIENQRDLTQSAAERADLDDRRMAAVADRDALAEQQKSARSAYVQKWSAPQKALASEPAPTKKPGFFSRLRRK